MERQKKIKEDGITLIALVVTIILLLILAEITIAELMKNGLLNKAQLAKEKQENSQIEENEILSEYENKITKYVDNSHREQEYNSIYPKGNGKIVDTGDFSNVKTYIAEEDGWIVLKCTNTGTGTKYMHIQVGKYLSDYRAVFNSSATPMCSLPCAKDVKITYRVWGTYNTAQLIFIPMK